MTGGRHRSNMELVAQGVANVASPIFGGIPDFRRAVERAKEILGAPAASGR